MLFLLLLVVLCLLGARAESPWDYFDRVDANSERDANRPFYTAQDALHSLWGDARLKENQTYIMQLQALSEAQQRRLLNWLREQQWNASLTYSDTVDAHQGQGFASFECICVVDALDLHLGYNTSNGPARCINPGRHDVVSSRFVVAGRGTHKHCSIRGSEQTCFDETCTCEKLGPLPLLLLHVARPTTPRCTRRPVFTDHGMSAPVPVWCPE